jgi:hypothetical protein
VPANSFAEYAPEPDPQTKKDVVWFARDDIRVHKLAGASPAQRPALMVAAG